MHNHTFYLVSAYGMMALVIIGELIFLVRRRKQVRAQAIAQRQDSAGQS